MDNDPAVIVRSPFEAFLAVDFDRLRELIDPNLEWTFLDPSVEDPAPQTCHGREQIEQAARRWASLGLSTEIEELAGLDDRVVVILHAPGLDRVRARTASDRNFHVVTVSDGEVIAIVACRDRHEARARAGFE